MALATVATRPQRDAAAEVRSLVTMKRDVHKARDVQERSVQLDGFESATIVSYAETQTPGGQQHTDVLVGDLPDGSVATLTVKADPQTHADDRLDAIVLTASAAGSPA